MRTFVEVLEERAERTPDRRVYRWLATGEGETASLTFGALYERALGVAAWLGDRGLTGRRVVLLLPPGLDFPAALLGCFAAGVTAAPAPGVDPARPGRSLPRLAAILRDAAPAAVVAPRAWHAFAEDPALAAPGVPWLAIEDAPAGGPARGGRPNAVAVLQYTSGSTSAPKGVAITHANLLAASRALGRAKGYGADSVSVCWVPHFHDDGLVHGLLQPIHAGCEAVLLPAAAFVARPARWLRAIDRYRATHAGGPDFAYALTARKAADDEIRGIDLSCWAYAYDAAEPVRPRTLRAFERRFAPHGFRWTSLAPCYGLAEATLTVTATPPGRGPRLVAVERAALAREGRAVARPDGDTVELVSSGAPVEGLRVEVVDPETRVRRAPGEIGEVWVAGAAVAAGYAGHPEETAATFGARLAGEAGPPFLRTGDLGFLHAGELVVTGRLKDLLKIGGAALYPQDIEQTVEAADAAVRPGSVAAFALEGDGEERVGLALEVAGEPDAAALFTAVRRAVAAAHGVEPAGIALLRPGTLPKTSSGKVRRGACRAAWLDGTLPAFAHWTPPPDVAALRARLRAASVDELPAVLPALIGELVASLLGLPSVDPERPFGELGLDSLLAVQAVDRLQTLLGQALPADLLVRRPTVAALGAALVPLERARRLLDEVEALSEDEAAARLGQGARRRNST